ncbi:redoxin domain-containing protein [Bradyrhizobium ontarionense]|uniref:thioredoxin-dependent peroxiredoxin n=1 Tax=Bradyrhizobium ontarionense TaxID=2898149 RepID=A0ABY3RE08_9BRAD|nr:peroxiredoxin [Bradyrhizobium sp. A19]UFZ05511.1 redoxin domain-containing protein [Bradyrhizobium sp. A19]
MSKESRKKSSNPSSYGVSVGNRPAIAAKKTTATKTSAKQATMAAKKTTAKTNAKISPKIRPKTSAKTGAAAAKSVTGKPKAVAPAKSATPATGGTGLAEGAKAPAFRLPRDGGGTVSLADHAGRKLVLFFYPKANTPGCTKEAIDFTRLSKDFAAAGTAVLGVSADTVKAQDSFRDKHGLAVPLISDETHEMLEAYGAWGEKSLYGRKFLGIIRSTVLIGADGRVAKIWRNVKVDGHADAVLAAARDL